MTSWGYATCGCRRGCPAGCRSTSTATTPLASLLRKRKIEFKLVDNAFVQLADWTRAQQIANGLEIKRLHQRLDEFARRFCPIHRCFGVAYHWSVDQCEYATDVVFKRQSELAAI